MSIVPKFTKNGAAENDESYVVVRKCRIKPAARKTAADSILPDNSKYCYQLEGDEIQAVVRKEVYEPKIKAVIGINLVNDLKESQYFLNSVVSVGDQYKTGQDRYRITEINQGKNTVKVKYLGDAKAFAGKDFEIGNVSILQHKLDADQKNKRQRSKRRGKNKE
jgi:hypothetical protein